MILPNPDRLSFDRWAGAVTAEIGDRFGVVLPSPVETQWQAWANSMLLFSFAQNVPQPSGYPRWQDWGERLVDQFEGY